MLHDQWLRQYKERRSTKQQYKRGETDLLTPLAPHSDNSPHPRVLSRGIQLHHLFLTCPNSTWRELVIWSCLCLFLRAFKDSDSRVDRGKDGKVKCARKEDFGVDNWEYWGTESYVELYYINDSIHEKKSCEMKWNIRQEEKTTVGEEKKRKKRRY